MPQQMSDHAPATEQFPQFGHLVYDLYTTELEGLTDEQLDFQSERWGWSQWSIRRNVSHVASGIFRWLLGRWAGNDLGQGLTLPDDAESISNPNELWLDESAYRTMDGILGKLKEGMTLCQGVLAKETVGSLRSKELARINTPQSHQMQSAHPSGVRQDPGDVNKVWIDLEYTFRHIYFEHITHLYNIQRLKRAQGLPTKVQVPKEGYWTLPDWDRSEP